MKIGDRVFVRGYIDEIRKDTVIIRNAGGYFGTIPSEVITGELPSAQPMMTNAADLINRGDAILAVYKRIKQLGMENDADVLSIRQSIRDLASAQPYTEEEIQAMQDLEQAQLDKAYELGWKEGREALRREIWEDGRDRLD